MANYKLSPLRSILIIINICVIIAYLLVCLVPFINTQDYWFIAMLGLVFPLLFFVLAFFVVLWATLKSGWWWISLIVLLLGFQQIIAVFGFNFPRDYTYEKNRLNHILMCWIGTTPLGVFLGMIPEIVILNSFLLPLLCHVKRT